MGLSDYIFPVRCHLCGAALGDGEEFLCSSCLASLPRTGYHRHPDNRMARHFSGLVPYVRASGHFFYSRGNNVAQLIYDLKYRRFRNLARWLGECAGAELLAAGFFDGIDAVVPVPMHFWKKAVRGYNQTEEIAVGIHRATGLPVITGLTAIRPHRTQTSLSPEQRRRNVSGIFRMRHPEEFEGKHLLILDDVCTTGSTLTAASEAVSAGAPTATLSLLTLACVF
jgi:ComF family protein